PEDWRGSPLDGLRRVADFFADLRAVEARRHGDPAERLLSEAPAGHYPRYYLRKLHFQTDGYLSAASAERYDHQVEVLVGGGRAAGRGLVAGRADRGAGRGDRRAGSVIRYRHRIIPAPRAAEPGAPGRCRRDPPRVEARRRRDSGRFAADR